MSNAASAATILLLLSGLSTQGVRQAQADQTFHNPRYGNYRLDWCYRWGTDCGEPAATAWRRANGFKDGAKSWQEAQDIGDVAPTVVMTTRKICNQKFCDGFSQITCRERGQ